MESSQLYDHSIDMLQIIVTNQLQGNSFNCGIYYWYVLQHYHGDIYYWLSENPSLNIFG